MPVRLLRDRQGRDAQGGAVDLGGPLLGQLAVPVVGVGPFQRVAGRLEAADHQLVAGVGAPVAADVAVGADQRPLRRNPRRAGPAPRRPPGAAAACATDISPSTPAMRLTTDECGPATLTTTGASISVPSASVDAGDAAAARLISVTADLEAEAAAMRLGGVLQVARGELRVVDVAAGREEHRARDLAVAVAEGRVLGAARRGEALGVVEGQLAPQPRGVPVLERDAELGHARADRAQLLIVLGLDHHRAALVEAGEPAIVGQAQMLGPAPPVVVALVGQGRAVQGRVVDPDRPPPSRWSSRSRRPAARRRSGSAGRGGPAPGPPRRRSRRRR